MDACGGVELQQQASLDPPRDERASHERRAPARWVRGHAHRRGQDELPTQARQRASSGRLAARDPWQCGTLYGPLVHRPLGIHGDGTVQHQLL